MSSDVKYTVAVIIPNWNGGSLLSDMLDSLSLQTFKDFRVFVVDDQSTDNSIEILKEHSAKDDRIKYFVRDREPKGAQTCRNIGFALCEGAKYIVFFDNDDLAAPFCLEQRVRFMNLHSDLDFAIFPAINFKEVPYDNPSSVWGYRFTDDTLKAMLNWNLPMVGWTNVYKYMSCKNRDLRWDEKLLSMQDSEFNLQAIIKGCKFDYADNVAPDYFYRCSQRSVSSKIFSEEHADSRLHIVVKIIDSLNDELQKKYEKDIEIYFLKFLETFFSNPDNIKKITAIKWVKHKKYFRFKIKLWLMTGHKHRILPWLFPIEFKRYKRLKIGWTKQVDLKLSNLLKMKESIVTTKC